MIHTEEEARKLLCVNPVVIWTPEGTPYYMRVQCEASQCMAWEWKDYRGIVDEDGKSHSEPIKENGGYCGLSRG